MSDPDSQKKQKQYEQHKRIVKKWEKEFKAKHRRIPSRHDFKEAEPEVRKSYNIYWKMKINDLDNSIALDDEDEFDPSELESYSQNDAGMPTPDVSLLTNDTSVILPTTSSSSLATAFGVLSTKSTLSESDPMTSGLGSEFETEGTHSINQNAWSQELNNKYSGKKADVNDNDASSKHRKLMSDKLFRNSSFTKRNPRKSLSRSSLTNSQSSHSLTSNSQKEVLPDLETLLSQKSQQLKETDEITETPEQANVIQTKKQATNIVNNFDREWLNRCNATNNIESDEIHKPALVPSNSTVRVQKFGLSNINTNVLANLEAAQLSSASAHSTLTFGMTNMNLFSSNSLTKIDLSAKINGGDSSDDEVANSEDETDKKDKPQIRSIRHVSNKRKHSEIEKPLYQKAVKLTDNNIDSNSKSVQNNDNVEKPAIKTNKRSTAKQSTKRKKETQTITRRTSLRRPASKAKVYVAPKLDGSSSEQEEADPFAGDDSDDDPTFDMEKNTKARSTKAHDSDSSDTIGDERPETTKVITAEKTKVVRKRVVRVASAVKTTRSQIRVRKSNNKSVEKIDDETEHDIPDNYSIELGLENIKNVPRIPVGDLQKNTEQFTKFVYCADSAPSKASTSKPSSTTEKPLSTKNSIAKDKLERKVAAGSLNENYVRLNLRKKVFVRGKKTMNFSRYKKKQWKAKKVAALSGPDMDMGGCDGGILICFQCGLPGHFAQNCKIKSDKLLPLTAVEEESAFPTLQEVEEMSKQKIQLAHGNRELPESDNPTWKADENENNEVETRNALESEIDSKVEVDTSVPTPPVYIGSQIPEDFLIKAGLLGNDSEDEKEIKPLYDLKSDGGLCDTPDEVFEALQMFGHKKFRHGQEKAVMRILSGQSTLVTLSTGSGKSLCYQLPAYLYRKKKKCITLVISPLVSLMEDQVHGVPHFLNAQCLHTNLTKPKRDATMAMIKSGIVDVLLISPEAVVASEKSTGFGSILRDLPPIAFVCIDEAHCVSQWSHNFRPSYLMICRVLHEKLKVKTVLGLTATATLSTRQSIVDHLMIPDGLDGVISDIPLPDNLTLSISCDENRDLALIELLKQPKFEDFKSIIIYCSRRDNCERVAKNLRTYFQDDIAHELQQRNASGKRRRTIKTTIEPYHAGLGASRRRTIQNAFMRGDLKIVVATIAFGMGINKADIRCVIHYNMPMNFESYVQEVGRAGRDGEHAHCHLFLDSKGEDKTELRRHIYANSIDRFCIRKLLEKIFIPCACKKADPPGDNTLESDLEAVQNINWNDDEDCRETKKRSCRGHEVAFSVDQTISELDIPEENISTLLCYLELHDQRFVKTLSKAYTRCKVFSYGGPKSLKNAALKCPPLAMAIALDLKKGISHDKSTFVEFPVVEIASTIGWNSGVVKYHLKQLEWVEENGLPKRSNISVEFYDLGFRLFAPGDLTPTELDSTLDSLYSRVRAQENNQGYQLENVFRGLSSVAVRSSKIAAAAAPDDERSEKLKALIRHYFQSNEKAQHIEALDEPSPDPATDRIIISDIRTMICQYPENKFTGRSLARIFHGVQSPVYPAVIWGRCKYWRAHMKTDFNHIVSLGNAEILKMKTH